MKAKNPYSKVSFGRPQVATELRLPVPGGSNERLVGHDGDINAGSRQELFETIGRMMDLANTSGGIITEKEAVSREELASVHQDMITAAFADKDALIEVGEIVAEELYVTANRDGIARRFMARQDLQQGQEPRVKMRMQNVVASVVTSPVKLETQLVRDPTFRAPEFYIEARPFVEQREINVSTTDVLDEKYNEALEAIMVREDRIWRNMALDLSGISNPYSDIVGTLDPTNFTGIVNMVGRWGIPPRFCLIARDIWNDIVSDTGFQRLIKEVSGHELLLTGRIANIIGVEMVTDAYRHPEHKFIEQGEIHVVGDPINHGQYTDRGGITASPIDDALEGVPGRGWHMVETMSMVIANARSVASGRRT
jgi:hypothetical protein